MRKRRSGRDMDSRRFLDWLDMADEDIASAGYLADKPECLNAAAFHCQQAIEKTLKAYILFKNGELVDGHNLTWLCKKAAREDAGFYQWLDCCAMLSHCYIETRYPADIPLDVCWDAVDGYYGTAREIYSFVCGKIEKFSSRSAAAESS